MTLWRGAALSASHPGPRDLHEDSAPAAEELKHCHQVPGWVKPAHGTVAHPVGPALSREP